MVLDYQLENQKRQKLSFSGNEHLLKEGLLPPNAIELISSLLKIYLIFERYI